MQRTSRREGHKVCVWGAIRYNVCDEEVDRSRSKTNNIQLEHLPPRCVSGDGGLARIVSAMIISWRLWIDVYICVSDTLAPRHGQYTPIKCVCVSKQPFDVALGFRSAQVQRGECVCAAAADATAGWGERARTNNVLFLFLLLLPFVFFFQRRTHTHHRSVREHRQQHHHRFVGESSHASGSGTQPWYISWLRPLWTVPHWISRLRA